MTPEAARDPIALFTDLFARARNSEPADATAVALATADASGAPSVRMVLLKGSDASGFVFFTNYESRKARELTANPRAALSVLWPTLRTQVRVEGTVARVAAAESDAYFATRPRESQLGAWASRQSAPVASPAALRHAFDEVAARFEGAAVTRPPFWGGFRITPLRIEFWTEGEYRLHDRVLYTRSGGGWTTERLFP